MKRFLKIRGVVCGDTCGGAGRAVLVLVWRIAGADGGASLGTGAEPVYDGFSTVFMLDAETESWR